MEENWNFEGEPTEQGWYAIAYCWEIQEGTFFGACRYENGWHGNYPITGFYGPFDTEEEALNHAKENDWEL